MSRTSEVQREAVEIFVADLQKSLSASQSDVAIREARNRVQLFKLMQLSDEPRIRKPMADTYRLVLRDSKGQLLVCDEYCPDDNGRVHCLSLSLYGTFHADKMVLEVRKVAFDVTEIVYNEREWPYDLADTSVEAICMYFG